MRDFTRDLCEILRVIMWGVGCKNEIIELFHFLNQLEQQIF